MGRKVHPEDVHAAAEVHGEGHGGEVGGPGGDAGQIRLPRGREGPPVVPKVLLKLEEEANQEGTKGTS